MKKTIILTLLLLQTAWSSTLTLEQLLSSAQKHSTLAKALQEESLSLEANNRADTALDPMDLFGTGAYARPDIGESGYEYSVGASRKIPLGDIKEQEREITRLKNQADLLEKERDILSFENRLKNLYHKHCLEYQNYLSFRQSYQDFSELYRKKETAFKYQEVSRVELMQLELEKNRLHAQLQELKMKQEASRSTLLMLSRVNASGGTRFSCSDLYPIETKLRLSGQAFQLSKEAYHKRVRSTQKAIQRYSSSLESIELSGEYSDEIDTKRAIIGVSIPLTFSSKRSEEKRAAALHENSAIGYRYEQEMLVKKSLASRLQAELKSSATMSHALQENIQNYKKKLLPLMKKSYSLGESSVMEYLLSRQQYYRLMQEYYQSKKRYYTTLFTLYSVSELKDNK